MQITYKKIIKNKEEQILKYYNKNSNTLKIINKTKKHKNKYKSSHLTLIKKTL